MPHHWHLLIIAPALALASCGASSPESTAAPAGAQAQPSSSPDTYAWKPLVPATGSLVLVDRETRSTFNLRGEAFAGPLAEKKRMLRQVPGVNMFWFAWSVFFPGSEIWGRADRVRAGSLPDQKNGDPACGGGLDCIPSLPNTGPPSRELRWASRGSSSAAYLEPSDLVLGVFFDGVARAYPHNLLWWHEIVNDRIGDRTFSVTFCPLTGSGLVWSAEGGRTLGVSGNLFNSNLVMYDHATRSLWPQLWMGAVSGPASGTWLTALPVTETTWAKWQELHPDTIVLGSDTGFSRDYDEYPYGDYRTDDRSTFRATRPSPDPKYPNKALTFGLADRPSGAARAYVHADLAKRGPTGAVADTFSGRPIVVAYDLGAQLVLAFEAATPEGTLTFDAVQYAP